MSKTIYLTTPLYYVNAAPHIGHSYTTVAADALARYYRLTGVPVFLLTGTDEHGQKVEQAAAAAGSAHPQEFIDEVVERFQSLWELLSISHDDFIRTTQPRHISVVQVCLTRLHDSGRLHHATYAGWYCTPCETFWTPTELEGMAGTATMCPSCQRPLESVTEEGWYLPLRGEPQQWLQRFLKTHPTFIQPRTRFNEIQRLLEDPLPEYLCITRPTHRVTWGVRVPFSDQHVTYVWFDALLNYISVPGYPDQQRLASLWPADVHFIGKDILRHHAVYWPIILHALGFSDEQMPRMIFAHGWWKIGEQKMSKSLGNIVDPTVVVTQLLKGQPYAADVYRYFLLREIPFGQDGGFSEEAIFSRLHADLANDLGNLVNRTLSMIERYCQAKIPGLGPVDCAVDDEPLRQQAVALPSKVDEAIGRMDFSTALEAIMRVVSLSNRYIESQAPWQLATQGMTARLDTVLAILAEVMRIIAITLDPFMPSIAEAIWQQLGCGTTPRRMADAARWPMLPAHQPIGPHPILFPVTKP